ncbi:rRNA pseudouridine synthase [Candidatus Woesearchaeota archaeon]|nr:rRNA pseudouridine synthase [Candidatus Woesearchaeota archaeon]
MLQRLQKIMASAGIASRRKCEEIIAAGRVTVNGSVARIGQSADPDKDHVKVDGKLIGSEMKVYIALYKPKGYVTTSADKFAKRIVTDLVHIKQRVYPVGRLDADAEGLLLMTNDGDFANRVMHPSYNVDKVYVIRLERVLSRSCLKQLESGVVIDGIKTWPAKARYLSPDMRLVEITIHEGRHKIVKRMFREVGNYVVSLVRVRIGNVSLGSLKPGSFRHLTEREVNGLRAE